MISSCKILSLTIEFDSNHRTKWSNMTLQNDIDYKRILWENVLMKVEICAFSIMFNEFPNITSFLYIWLNCVQKTMILHSCLHDYRIIKSDFHNTVFLLSDSIEIFCFSILCFEWFVPRISYVRHRNMTYKR